MRIFDRFKKTPKTPLTKVSLKYAETKGEIHVELCHLAWQWTIGNATYDDAVDVIQEGKPFIIPKDDYAQLDVRDYRVYDGEKGRSYYWPDDEEGTPAVVLRKGKILGCICEGKNSVEDLADRDDAHMFIERLEQLHKMYAEVESGKKLPKEEPKKKEEGSNKKEKEESNPRTKTEEQQETTKTEEQKPLIVAFRPLYDHWGELNNDQVSDELGKMTYPKREELFDKLEAELENVKEGVEKYFETYVGGIVFYANAIKDFNHDGSSAAKFLKKLEDERKKKEKPQEEKPDDKSGGKKEDPNKDTKQKNFISRQKKKVNSWIRQAEAADDEDVLDVLDDMKIALDKGDIETYKKRKALYDRLVSADQRTNPKKDSSADDTGKDEQTAEDSGSEEESKDENPEDTTSEEETSEESAGSESEDADADATPEDEQEDEEDDTEYTIQDVILMLKLTGYDEVPKPIRLLAKNRKVTKESLQQVLETYGIEGVI